MTRAPTSSWSCEAALVGENLLPHGATAPALLAAGGFAAAIHSFRQLAAEDRQLLSWCFLLCSKVCTLNAAGAYWERYRDSEEGDDL